MNTHFIPKNFDLKIIAILFTLSYMSLATVEAKPKKCPHVSAATQQAAYKELPELIEHRELQKQLASAQRIPKEIKEKYDLWKAEFLEIGIDEMKKRPGWHDEPLKGNLSGCRSVRLSGQARLIYKARNPGQVEVLWIDPKHSYDGVCPN